MILDHSYFVGELLIPGISGTSPGHIAAASDLDWFIAKYENEYLCAILGEDFADAVITDMDLDAGDRVYTELEGKIWDDDFKLSPVAAYVYYFYWRNRITESTQMNEVRTFSENAVNQSGMDKMVFAWNTMVELSQHIWDYLIDNAETYTLFDADREFPFEKINNMNL